MGGSVSVEALQAGDPHVLGDLLDLYGQEIQSVAYLILRDRAAAEDVLVETLLSALDRARSLRDPNALRPWLLRIAANHALGRQRRDRRIRFISVVPDVPSVDVDVTDRVTLLAGLDGLPTRTRAAVVLHYYADLSVAEVATAMGTSPNTVKTQLRTALQALRVALTEGPTVDTLPEVARG
jgi:RNA polymerase sigma-70 factor (ECF subfamily)